MRLAILIVIGLGLALLFATCGESPTTPTDTVTLSGAVKACICTPDDPANDTLNPYYAMQTGRPAYVEMTRIDGDARSTVATLTDQRSRFRLHAVEGQWQVTITTAHSYRAVVDTLDLTGNTAADYMVRYRFRDPDTIDIYFKYVLSGPGNFYDPECPTETEYIEILNDSIGGPLNPDKARLSVDSLPIANELYHRYAVPITEQTPPYWPLTNDLPYWVYRWGSRLPSATFPENMFVSTRTYPLCPEDVIIVIDTSLIDTFRPPGP